MATATPPSRLSKDFTDFDRWPLESNHHQPRKHEPYFFSCLSRSYNIERPTFLNSRKFLQRLQPLLCSKSASSGVWTNIILAFFYTTPLHFESEGVLWAELNTPPTKSLYLLVFHYINYSSCSSIVWEEGALQWITSIHLGILHHSCQFSKKNFLEHKLWDISNFGNNIFS